MAVDNLNFTCPYCGRVTTITGPNYWENWGKIYIQKPNIGEIGLFSRAITCPNSECNKLWLNVGLYEAIRKPHGWGLGEKIFQWQLLPESEAKVLPEYIPEAIQNDYYEACRIRNLSPKASATLSRRCLQGMIRDFWGIKKRNLYEEIKELEDKIDFLEWQAIDAVRKVGNIGAHMEKDINLIVDVDPKEAQLLIGLIEQLIDDWYVTRHEKERKLKQIQELAHSKTEVTKKVEDNDTKP